MTGGRIEAEPHCLKGGEQTSVSSPVCPLHGHRQGRRLKDTHDQETETNQVRAFDKDKPGIHGLPV